MKITIACNYCGKRWQQYVYSSGEHDFKCAKCSERKNFSVIKSAEERTDYYVGSPPFPDENQQGNPGDDFY